MNRFQWATDIGALVALAGVGSYGTVFHTKIARSGAPSFLDFDSLR
jgi:hypothetical protein